MSGHWSKNALGVVALGLGVALLNATVGEYGLSLIAVACAYAIAAIAVDISWGYGGILSFAHSVFFGAGAFGVALMVTAPGQGGVVVVEHEGPVYMALGGVLGMAIAFAIALVVGVIAFWTRRSSVLTTAVITLSVSLTAVLVVSHARELTGGDDGIAGFALLGVSSAEWLWISVAALVAVAALCARVLHSDFGVVIRATRDNEGRMWFLGYDVRKLKLAVFASSALVCAFAGALYAAQVGIVSPPLFDFAFALNLVIWVGIGGRGTLVGAVIGALMINIAGPEVSAEYPYLWTLFIGLAFVAIVVALPGGLYGALTSGARALTDGLVRRGPRRTRATNVSLGLASPTERSDGAASTVLRCEDVRFAHGALKVLRGIDLEIRRPELLCLVGPNGAGKSTLLSVLADGRRPVEGRITTSLEGVSRHAGTPEFRLVRAGVVYKFQAASLFETLTVAEVLLLALQRGRWPSWWRRSRTVNLPAAAYRIAQVTGLDSCAGKRVDSLPHGLRQALELVVAVTLEPDVILLDEPTAGLTADERSVIGGVLRTLVDDLGLGLVLVEHDIDFVQQIADRIVVLHEGRLVMDGDVDEVVDSALVRDAYLGVAG